MPFHRRRPMTGLDKWYAYIKSHDRAALWDLLDPEAVFESPVVHTPQRGREITFKYLLGADKVLGGPGFGAATPARCSSSKTRSMASGSMASTSSLSGMMAGSRISR